MRLQLSCALLLLGAVTAQAAPISYSLFRENLSTSLEPPQTIIWKVGPFNGPVSGRVGLEIPNVEADDRNRLLHYSPDDGLERVWTITEANAANYGLDWSEFESRLLGIQANRAFFFGFGSIFGFNQDDKYYWSEFDLERLEVEVSYYFWHPLFEELRAYRFEGRIFGDGTVLPEPTAGVLAMLCAGIVVCKLRRRHRMV
jgi:hypothetical protein